MGCDGTLEYLFLLYLGVVFIEVQVMVVFYPNWVGIGSCIRWRLHLFRYGAGTRALLPQLLKKDARGRPSADIILRNPLIKDRIRRFLTEEQVL